jgi:hypothetical protein
MSPDPENEDRAIPHPDDPDTGAGTAREDRFGTHNVPAKDHGNEDWQPGKTPARPGTIGVGASEQPMTPSGTDGEDVTPHDMSSDIQNPQHEPPPPTEERPYHGPR